MDFAADVREALRGATEPFGPAAGRPAEPLWGALLLELRDGADAGLAVAVELIYEGYLCHYRQSRCVTLAGDDGGLLAGDYLYARGLREFAVRGQAAAVDLLARLMAACSCLRAAREPFAGDDALWAYTMGGLAALAEGAASTGVTAPFSELDDAFAGGERADALAVARDGASRLALRAPGPLLRALSDIHQTAGTRR